MSHASWLRLMGLLLGLAPAWAWAQSPKAEYETRIDPAELPVTIQELLTPLRPHTRRERFFQEVDGAEQSYEYKAKWQGRWLSVEFYDQGQSLDIEEICRWRDLPAAVRDSLAGFFTRQYDGYRLRRLQQQYTPADGQTPAAALAAFQAGDRATLQLRYEIEAEVKADGRLGEYEFLFDASGRLLQQRPIVRRPTDHVLY